MGILVSHRVAGPIYRMIKFLDDVTAGDYSQKLVLRKHDELKDMADARTYKKVVEHINEELEDGFNELISEADGFFISGEPAGDTGYQDEDLVEDIRKVKT